MATGTVTITELLTGRSVKKVTWAWTSTAGGDASDVTTGVCDGDLIGFATVPSGVTAPTDDYDVTITDSDSLDVLLGAGADRDTANTEYVNRQSIGAVSKSTLTLNVTNAGDSKLGTAILWFR